MNRDFNIKDFFKRIQIEYVVTELRSKFYPEKDSVYFKDKVMKRKEKKIKDIEDENIDDSDRTKTDQFIKKQKERFNEIKTNFNSPELS